MDVSQSTSKFNPKATLTDHQLPEFAIKRRYGHVGYERFDHILFAPLPAGSAEIGKAIVDCKFLFKKSLWGVLCGKSPAGILYLDLGFAQSQGHRLKAATVTVKLDDEDSYLQKQRHGQIQFPQFPVHIGNFGPTELREVARVASKSETTTIKPEVNFGTLGSVSGVGHGSEIQYGQELRWKFSGSLNHDPNSESNLPAGKVLRWRLEENKLEEQPSHSNTMHTAFSFHHDCQPFLMHITIEGQLRNRLQNLKTKFGSSQSDTSTTSILVTPGGHQTNSRPLDEKAKNLDAEMRKVNERSITIEIPTVNSTTSQGIETEEQLPTDTSRVMDGNQDQHNGDSNDQNIHFRTPALWEATYEARNPSEVLESGDEDNQYLPTTQNLQNIIDVLSALMTPPDIHSRKESFHEPCNSK